MSVDEHFPESAPDYPINEPGTIISAKWYIEEIVDNPSEYLDLIDKVDKMDSLVAIISTNDELFESLGEPRYTQYATVRRFWRNVGLMETARLGEPTEKADSSLLWNFTASKSAYDVAFSLAHVGMMHGLWSKRNIKSPDQVEAVSRQVYGNLEEVLIDLATPIKSAKCVNESVSRSARFMATKLAEIAETTKIVTRDGLTDKEYYQFYMDSIIGVYMLTALSGKKGTYDIVADKLDRIERAEQKRHNIKPDFFNEMVGICNDSPEGIASALARHRRLGAVAPDDYYIKACLLKDLSRSLRLSRNNPHELQANYQRSITEFITSRMPIILHTPIEEVRIINGAEDKNTAATAPHNGSINPEPIMNEILKPMELDWEVLPPGDLAETAREIVNDINKSTRTATIDLERLNTLANIRDMWGADRTYYARGNLAKRHNLSRNGKELPDEYIILVLQDADHQGNIIGEHAIAESPIAGPHAAYVYRQDTSDSSITWREVMSLPKKHAREFGARSVKHTRSAGEESLTSTMSEKICLLLSCKPEEFVAIQFKGSGRISLGSFAVGQSAELRNT